MRIHSFRLDLENTVSIPIISDSIRNRAFSRNDNIESLDVDDDGDEELI